LFVRAEYGNSSLSISLYSTTKVSSTIGTIVRNCPARGCLERLVVASSSPSVVSRKARAFQPAAETRDGEHTLRLLSLKSDQGPILCVGSFQGEASGFAFECALIDFIGSNCRLGIPSYSA